MPIPDPLPPDGYSIPLKAAFLVPKRLPLLSLGSNSAFPKLVLFPDGLAYRVFGLGRKAYDDIERVDVFQGLGTQNVILVWKGSFLAFSANVGDETVLVEVLRFFDSRGIPLAEKARALVRQAS